MESPKTINQEKKIKKIDAFFKEIRKQKDYNEKCFLETFEELYTLYSLYPEILDIELSNYALEDYISL